MIEFHRLTPDRWNDFEQLFGPKGAYGGCWCMYWRITRKEFEAGQGENNRCAMKSIVKKGKPVGLLGYVEQKAVAWCAVAPREVLASLNRSPVLKPLDDEPVWSLTCLFVDKDFRGQGFAGQMINGVVDHVRAQKGSIIEAYPTVPKSIKVPPVSSYMGFPALFERHGFVLCASPSESKRVMRYYLERE